MILGSHQDVVEPEQDPTINQGAEKPPRDTRFDEDEPADKEPEEKDLDQDQGKGFDPIRAGNYYALMSLVHLVLVDYLANEEGDQYYMSKKKSGSGNGLFKTSELFNEVKPLRTRARFGGFFRFNKWMRSKKQVGGRLQASKNPYNSGPTGDFSDYGLGYELMMIWHNLAFSSSIIFWMLSQFADVMYTPFVYSVKFSLLGPVFFYPLIFAMLISDSYDSTDGFNGELVGYSLIYLALSFGTAIAQKILSAPILDDYQGEGRWCDPEEDEDCCDPEDEDCILKKLGCESDEECSDDEDYDYDENCESGDEWCEGKDRSKRRRRSRSDSDDEQGSEDEEGSDNEEGSGDEQEGSGDEQEGSGDEETGNLSDEEEFDLAGDASGEE